MNHSLLSSLILVAMFLAACQPIRPEAELTPTAASSTITATTDITTTVGVTETVGVTATTPFTESAPITDTATLTPSVEITPTDAITSTALPSTPTQGTDAPRSLAASCPALGETPLDLIISAAWQAGDQRTYLVKQRQVEIVVGEETVILDATTPVTITVLEVNEDGYILEWGFGEAEFGAIDAELPDPLQNLMQTPLEVVFEYATDVDGAYLELLNVEDLQAQIEPLIDQIFAAIVEADDNLDAATIEAARGMVDRTFSDPANFDAIFTNEVQLFHTLYGFYFEDAAPIVLPDSRPNILGGPPIPSELTITPTHYDRAQGCLHVAFENIADPVAARDSILESLQEQARQMGVPAPDLDDLPSELELVDNIQFEMDLTDGWPTAIYLERATSFGPEGRLDSAEIILVE